MSNPTQAEWLAALVAELAAAIEAIGGTSVQVAPGSGISGPGWTLSLAASGTQQGSAQLTLDADGVTALLHLVLGSDADTSDGAARDLLTELSNQAIGGLRRKPGFAGLQIGPAVVESATVAADQTTLFALTFGEHTMQAAGVASLTPIAETTAVAAQPSTRRPERAATATTAVPTSNLEVVLDIELPLSVRFGSTVMSIRALSSIGPGSIVDMGRSPDDPVEILVCGRPIAKAEVVIVGGNYGVRITDLTSPMERIRAMEGQL